MKVNELWLREWVNPDVDVEKIAQQLTMAGLEVDAVVPVAGQFSKVVVGEVQSTEAHPEADRLTLCQVDVGESELLPIVCGASNVRPQLKVAVALVGARLPGDFKIKKSKLRGQPSHGMLCAETELGLSDQDEGIMELPQDAPIGVDLRHYLQLDDYTIDIDLTPNRGDCLSVKGIATEVAVLNEMQLEPKPIAEVAPSIDDVIKVTLQAKEQCPQYCCRVVRGIDSHAETPLWMAERLRRCGLRVIHPVVDVTNYVMLELGQPMHAFDEENLSGGITVRLAQDNEELTLLDEQTVKLRPDTLVIADDDKPLAIAGVMGGLHSGVSESSQDIVFESAYFDFANIAGVARSYGLSTDSSHRFERGVDPALQQQAIERATELLVMIAGGKPGPVVIVNHEELLPQAKTVTLRPVRVNQLLGLALSDDLIANCLTRLAMTVDTKVQPWQVGVPARRFDIAIEEDLIEEVARVYGYHNIESKPVTALTQAHPTKLSISLMGQLSEQLVGRGYQETISYSFVDPQLQQVLYGDIDSLSLLNPISPELSHMRFGLWNGLLASFIHNLHRQQGDMRLFETGLCFIQNKDSLTQVNHIGGLIAGKSAAKQWNQPSRDVDFYDIKGDVEALLNPLIKAGRVAFIAAQHHALHPGQSAAITIDGKKIGAIGALHPAIATQLDIDVPVFLFELSIDDIPAQEVVQYQTISKYPAIGRDLSFLVANEITVAQIEQAIWQCMSEQQLRKFEVFDVYQGKNIPDGKKSIAIGLTFQHACRTLIDTDINSAVDAILKTLVDKFDIILRD